MAHGTLPAGWNWLQLCKSAAQIRYLLDSGVLSQPLSSSYQVNKYHSVESVPCAWRHSHSVLDGPA